MKRKYKILIGIIALIIVIRIILPYAVLHYANKTLTNINGYIGHIDDIDLSLLRGAYTINDIFINKVDSVTKKQIDFFKSKDIDLSIEWRSIIHGSTVGEMEFDSPLLIFTRDKMDLSDVKRDTNDFRKLLKDFMPLKVNRVVVNNGVLHYVDNTTEPKVDAVLEQMHLLGYNLTNVIDDKVELPSTVEATATVYEGTMSLDMKVNLLNEHPTFDLNAEMKNTNLVFLNDFFRAYGNFDVNKGNFGLYTEMATKAGKFKGYVKPIIKNLDVVGLADKNDNVFNKIYEQIIGAAGVILRNQKKSQVATKINIEGNFEDPKPNTLEAIWEVLRNAFIQALLPSIDHEINLKSVEVKKADE